MKKSGGLKTAAAAVAAFGVGSVLLVRKIFRRVFSRNDRLEDSVSLWYKDLQGINRRKVTIAAGAARLVGYIYGEPSEKGLVVICHGIGSGGEDNMCMAQYMLQAGYQVFTFDYTGVYESEGASSLGFYQSVKDLDKVLSYIEKAGWRDTPVFLYGHSWGGYTVAAELNLDHKIAGVVSVSGFSTPMTIVKEASAKLLGRVFSVLEMPFAALYQRVLFGRNYNLSAVDGINRTDVPVLVMHGTEDEVISYDHASIIACRNRITNPHVQYYTENRPGKSGHVNIFYTKESGEYHEAKKRELKLLRDIFYNRVPKDVQRRWFSKLDKAQANEMDMTFVRTVIDFLDRVSAKRP